MVWAKAKDLVVKVVGVVNVVKVVGVVIVVEVVKGFPNSSFGLSDFSDFRTSRLFALSK